MSTFFHGEDLGFDVAVDFGFVLQLAALGSDFAFDIAVDFNFTGTDIAFYPGVFTDGDFAFVRSNFTFDLSIDDHVVGEADGADNFDSGGEDVSSVCHSTCKEADGNDRGNGKHFRNTCIFGVRKEGGLR